MIKKLQDHLKAIEMITLAIEKRHYAKKGDRFIPNNS